jgi:hypothetical protein
VRYATNEQRRRRTLFKPTIRAMASWLIFRVAHLDDARRSRLENQPAGRGGYASYLQLCRCCWREQRKTGIVLKGYCFSTKCNSQAYLNLRSYCPHIHIFAHDVDLEVEVPVSRRCVIGTGRSVAQDTGRPDLEELRLTLHSGH